MASKRANRAGVKRTRSTTTDYGQVYVPDRAAWRAWLTEHHATSRGVWLIYDKKGARPDRLQYNDAVEEALCFGWIDSLASRLDDSRYRQLFTPRKPKSTWSRLNKERVERLIAAGLMHEAGVAAVDVAKRNGSWTSLDAVHSLEVPPDLATALRKVKGARRNFDAFPASVRKVYLYWITSAKRPETRARRVAAAARSAGLNRRIPMGSA